MSEQAVEETTQGPEDTGSLALEPEADRQEAATQTESKAPWADYLTDLPESVRPLVEPKFREWDASVTKRFQSLQSEYDPYKPLFDEYEPGALEEAISIAQAMESNPQEFLTAVAKAYGLDQGTADKQEEAPAVDDDPVNSRMTQHEELLRAMAETLISEREAKQYAEADTQLDNLLKDLRGKHGDFDEGYVLSLMAQEVEPEAAVAQFKAAVEAHVKKSNAPTAPRVVGASGNGYPTQQKDLTSLDSKGRKNLVVEMLAAANEQKAP